jgi:hypothetical protein
MECAIESFDFLIFNHGYVRRDAVSQNAGGEERRIEREEGVLYRGREVDGVKEVAFG